MMILLALQKTHIYIQHFQIKICYKIIKALTEVSAFIMQKRGDLFGYNKHRFKYKCIFI